MKAHFNIEGYSIIIPHVQNVYPVDKDKIMWEFGFKYKSGMWEFFYFETKAEANNCRKEFLKAIDKYYDNHNST